MALKFVSREEWGAKPPKSVTQRSPKTLSGVAVHWFGSPRAEASHEGCKTVLQGVQRTHMGPGGLGVKQGGNDIAYNHAVCPHGFAFTLRGFGVQTGANGDSKSNEEFAAVVFMGGQTVVKKKVVGIDKPSDEVLQVLAEVIRLWQAKGAGPLVKPHQFFTGSDCPGPQLMKWVDLIPHPWAGKAGPGGGGGGGGAGGVDPVPVEDETPPWLIDFIFWRLALNGDPAKRPRKAPKQIPESAWEAAARMDRMATLMGPPEAFLDYVAFRRSGGKKNDRPRSLPESIPKAWVDSFKQLERVFSQPV